MKTVIVREMEAEIQEVGCVLRVGDATELISVPSLK